MTEQVSVMSPCQADGVFMSADGVQARIYVYVVSCQWSLRAYTGVIKHYEHHAVSICAAFSAARRKQTNLKCCSVMPCL